LIIQKSFKYRLYPTPPQAAQFRQLGGNARFVYNHLLELSTQQYEKNEEFILGFSLDKQLVNMKKEFPFLKLSYSQSLQAASQNLARAFLNKFKSRTAGFPQAKKKNYNDSFTYKQNWTLGRHSIVLPKVGRIRLVKHRPVEGRCKTVTISQGGDQWFASVLCEVEIPDPQPEFREEDFVGIDVGIKSFAVLSDGSVVENPKFLRKGKKKICRAQRRLSRKVKGSKNRTKARLRVARAHRKVRRQREDFQHKVSSRMIAKYSGIALETLNIRGMMKNHKRSGAIADCAWGGFARFLEYKGRWAGKPVVRLSQWYPSTQTCSVCGERQTMLLRDRVYICPACGLGLDRDMNASLNIRGEGLWLWLESRPEYLPVDDGDGGLSTLRPVACGEVGVPTSVKQEKDTRTCLGRLAPVRASGEAAGL